MSHPDLYDLLPSIYRDRDAGQGEPLRLLLAALQSERDRMRADVWQLYDGWFIETCPEWAIPLIGDLLGVPRVEAGPAARRAEVANALRHRRRKGTPRALAGAARDASGWPVEVVEFFEFLALSEPMRDLAATLSEQVDLEPVSTGRPPAQHVRSVRVRAGARGLDEGNVQEIAVVVHRLLAAPLVRATPGNAGPRSFTFDPLGGDVPLFITGSLPRPMTAAALSDDLAAHAAARAAAGVALPPAASGLVGPERSVCVWLGDTPVAPEQVAVADLSGDPPGPAEGVAVWLDPERGRLALPAPPEAPVRVDWAFGRPSSVGAGPWSRQPIGPTDEPWCGVVSAAEDPSLPGHFTTVQAAVDAWAAAGGDGYVRVLDSGTYPAPVLALGNRALVVEAAPGERPCLLGDLKATGGGAEARCVLAGLLIGGAVRLGGDLALRLAWCTVPGGVQGGAGDLVEVRAERCLLGPVRLPADSALFTASDTVVDGCGKAAIEAAKGAGPVCALARATLLGLVHVAEVSSVEDCLFADRLHVQRQHDGLVSLSTFAAGSEPPRTRHCLVHGDAEAGTAESPRFVSTDPAAPGYAQLVPEAGPFLEGARDGAEYGAFHDVFHPQRVARLRGVLLEFVPAGVTARVAFAS